MTQVTGQNQAVWAGLSFDGTSSAIEGSANLTSQNYIGIAADTYADNEATIGIVGCIDRNQTGLTAGQQYFVQVDGTLSTQQDRVCPSIIFMCLKVVKE